jgi:uncharacterized membrane protein
MQYLGLMFVLALLATNLWSLGLAAGLVWRNRWIAVVLGPIAAVTGFYGIECHVGLGPSLGGLGLVLTLVSVTLAWFSASSWEPAALKGSLLGSVRLWRAEFAPRRYGAVFAVFAGVFLYAFAWRFALPDVDGSSEKLADFSYICSYARGGKIPVVDAWYYPYLSTQYYSLQHYGAALLGRLLSVPPGEAYNLGFCVLIALGGASFAGAVALASERTWVRSVLLAGFLVGGTGMTLLVHLTDREVRPWTSMRYIGSAPKDKDPWGGYVRGYEARYPRMDMPGEPFSYSIYLGDYHAPLSGYMLLGLGAMAVGLWTRTRRRRYAAVAGATLTWTLLANTWLLPLQALGLAGWLVVASRDWRTLVPWVAAGAAAVWLLAWVYLSAFVYSASGYDVALRMVPWREHSPPFLWLLFLLPTVALIVLGLSSGTAPGRRLGLLWAALLFFSEFFFVDDVYGGMYDRFNTTLKWWPWIAAGTLMTLGPVVLEGARRRWVRVAGLVFCLYPCCYAYDLWKPLVLGPKPSLGKLEGSAYLTRETGPRLVIDRLKVEPPGVAVERPEAQGGFTNSAAVPLFAGQAMWLGWFGHEELWRGYSPDVQRRHSTLERLYAGDLTDAGRWLKGQGIDYVLWYRAGDTTELWPKVNESIGPEYLWCELLGNADIGPYGQKVGFWKRAPRRGRALAAP